VNVEFASGVRVRLVELHQTETYEGLLEGLPTTEMNAETIKALREERPGVYVIPPIETPIEWNEKRPYPFGRPASLPGIRCLVRLRSWDGDFFREGAFAWFQGTWGLPIDDAALEAFRRLHWAAHSAKHEV
jgi:hypothetical protein